MVSRAVLLALVTMVAWGGWAIFAKLATESLRPEVAMLLSYANATVIAVGYVLTRDVPLDPIQGGTKYALMAGVASAVGAIALYAGLERGSASIVTTISALYFVVAAVVSIFLFGDAIGPKEFAGIGFAVLSIVLLTS